MIKRLKTKFVILTMVSLLVLLLVIVSGMNIINYHSVVDEADEILSLLSNNKGMFPDFGGGKFDKFPPHMSPELPYESRYFSVLLDENAKVIFVDISRISVVSADMAKSYALSAIVSQKDTGFIEDFRFNVTSENGGTRITFLDCGRKLAAFRDFLFASIVMSLAGLAIAFLVIFFFAGKIIRPMAESYKKQKRFITDAGHEIKTPLTIINANADVLEMETGENECISDIKQQTARLAKLTNNLIYLARMEEAENTLTITEIPVSELVRDTASSFKTLAQTMEKEVALEIAPMLSMKGNESAIEQLVTILMDNALKYSPRGGKIRLTLGKQGKNICLAVQNDTLTPLPREQLDLLFERFYRADSSHNSATGGHGIGLSIAQAIVNAHGGKIRAESPCPDTLLITAIFIA